MKYRSKKGTVINIPDDLDPKEIAKIKADADAGYGTRAQQTANQAGKSGGKKKKPDPLSPTPTGPYDPNTGMINDPNTWLGTMPNFDDFKGEVEKAAKASYDFATRDFDRQEAERMEATKQELAERGIPIGAGPGNLYGQMTGQVTRDFADARQNANNAAYAGALESGLGAYGTSLDAFLTGALGLNEQQLQKYGIDKDYLAKIKAIKAQKQMANQNRGGSSGGGGGGQSGGGAGFEIIG